MTALHFIDCDYRGQYLELLQDQNIFPHLRHLSFHGQVEIDGEVDTQPLVEMLRLRSTNGLQSFELRLRLWSHQVPSPSFLSFLGELADGGMDIRLGYGIYPDLNEDGSESSDSNNADDTDDAEDDGRGKLVESIST